MRAHVVHWGDVAPKLPFGGDHAAKMKRKDLFEACDPRGIGLLSQAEVVRYYFRLLPPVGGVTDIKVVLNLCFRVARETITPVVHIGSQQLDRNQFRGFLTNIWYYIKLWEIFCTLDESRERVVRLDQFQRLIPSMVEWGFGEVSKWMQDPESAFRRLDRGGCGEVSFDEFAEFCLRHGTPKLAAPCDEEERKAALEVLVRTQPHLASKVAPSVGGPKNVGIPPVPPPGQKLPPSLPSSASSSPHSADSKMKRWSSQYMVDYAPHSRRSSRPGSLAVSAVPTPARTRASTPGGCSKESPGGNRKEDLLKRQSSAPSITSSLNSVEARGDLDRGALRSKLEANLGMYNTCQMRRILEVAGGMVVGPK